ncbi:hypothetical protein Tco_1328911 [Tanacetum coccineum]
MKNSIPNLSSKACLLGSEVHELPAANHYGDSRRDGFVSPGIRVPEFGHSLVAIRRKSWKVDWRNYSGKSATSDWFEPGCRALPRAIVTQLSANINQPAIVISITLISYHWSTHHTESLYHLVTMILGVLEDGGATCCCLEFCVAGSDLYSIPYYRSDALRPLGIALWPLFPTPIHHLSAVKKGSGYISPTSIRIISSQYDQGTVVRRIRHEILSRKELSRVDIRFNSTSLVDIKGGLLKTRGFHPSRLVTLVHTVSWYEYKGVARGFLDGIAGYVPQVEEMWLSSAGTTIVESAKLRSSVLFSSSIHQAVHTQLNTSVTSSSTSLHHPLELGESTRLVRLAAPVMAGTHAHPQGSGTRHHSRSEERSGLVAVDPWMIPSYSVLYNDPWLDMHLRYLSSSSVLPWKALPGKSQRVQNKKVLGFNFLC